jgi:hypothetical protein
MHQQRGASGALLSVLALTYGPQLAFAQCDSGITYSAQCGTAQCPEGFPVCTAARAAATGTSALQGPDGSVCPPRHDSESPETPNTQYVA